MLPRLACPSWRWMMLSGTPSRASSTAWAWRSWCGANRRRTPACVARRRNSTRTAASTRPARVSGRRSRRTAARPAARDACEEPGASCSQPQASIPISRRRPPLPWRTSSDPRRGSRSGSASESASWMRSPPRQSTTINARTRAAVTVVVGLAHHGDDLLDGRRVGRVAASPCCEADGQRGSRAGSLVSDAGRQNRER